MHRLVVAFLALTLVAQSAFGVAKVTTPVSKLFDESASVLTGKVTKVSADTGVVEAAVTTLKGDGVGGDAIKVRVEIPDVLKNVREGAPVVLLLGRRAASNTMHLGDTWLFPQPAGGKTSFFVKSDLEKNLKQSFPGSTAAVVSILQEIKTTGKSTVLDAAGDVFKGEMKDLGKLDAPGATGLVTLHLQGKPPTVFPTGKEDAKGFVVTAQGVTPAETPLPTPIIDALALSQLAHGLATLKKDGQLSVGATNTKLWPDASPATAAAFGNFGEEPDKIYALVIKDNNIYRYALEGSQPPADFYRLTGERITNYHKDNPNWLSTATAQPLDVNADGRTDVLINSAAGPMLLINRGHGAFFIDNDLAKILVDKDNKPLLTEKTLWTATDIDGDKNDDLLILAPDSKLTAVLNPKIEKKN
jgi:hypothetical protein